MGRMKITEIIDKIDRLDGRKDGKYQDIPLKSKPINDWVVQASSTVAACEHEPGKEVVSFTRPGDGYQKIEVSCPKLLERLEGLEKEVPENLRRLFQDAPLGKESTASVEEWRQYLRLHLGILMLLQATISPEKSLEEILAAADQLGSIRLDFTTDY